MKTLPLKIIVIIALLFSVNSVNAQLTVDVGNDTIYCGDSLQIGGAPTAIGGTPPYTYVWETSYTDTAGLTFTASALLDDTTVANPLLIFLAVNDKSLTFKLTVTDTLNNAIIDSSKVILGYYPFLNHLSHGVGYINLGDSVLLEPGGLNWDFYPFNYQWFPNYNLSDSTLQNPWAKPDTTTQYYCIITSVAGCQSPIQYSTVYVNPLSVDENELNKSIKFYPNPSSNHLIIENLRKQKSNVVIEIRSITGKFALLKNVGLVDRVTINTSQLPTGVYVVTVKDEQHVIVTKKWVKSE